MRLQEPPRSEKYLLAKPNRSELVAVSNDPHSGIHAFHKVTLFFVLVHVSFLVGAILIPSWFVVQQMDGSITYGNVTEFNVVRSTLEISPWRTCSETLSETAPVGNDTDALTTVTGNCGSYAIAASSSSPSAPAPRVGSSFSSRCSA